MSRRHAVVLARSFPVSATSLLASLALTLPLAGCGSGIAGALPSATKTPTIAPSAVKSGPQLGYIWSEKARTLRPVLGIAGSSQLGQSVVPADLYIAAATSANSSLAILQESDGALDLMTLPTGEPVRLSATLAPTAQIRFSPTGNTAIAFVPGSSSVTLLAALSTTPKSSTVAFNAAVSDAAVSDAGTIASAVPQSSGSSVRTISATGAANTAGSVATLGGLSFVGSSDDLLLADATSNTVTLVRNSASAPAATQLPSASLLKTPQGIGATHDGHYAVLANTGNTSIVRVDLTAQTPAQSFPCNCQPALVAQLSGTGVFRVTGADSGPAWMIDASASTPRVLFIPASSSSDTDSASTSKTSKNQCAP